MASPSAGLQCGSAKPASGMWGGGPPCAQVDSSTAPPAPPAALALAPLPAPGEPSSEVPPAEAEALDPERTWDAPTGAAGDPAPAAAANTLGASSPEEASLVTASHPPRNSPPTKQ